MSDENDKLLIDIRELSALTGIKVGTLYHWISEMRVPHVRLSQRCVRFSLPAIREWLAGLSQPANEGESTRHALDRSRSPARRVREGR